MGDMLPDRRHGGYEYTVHYCSWKQWNEINKTKNTMWCDVMWCQGFRIFPNLQPKDSQNDPTVWYILKRSTVLTLYFTAELITTLSNYTIRFSLSLFYFFLDGQQIWEMEATVDKDKSQPVRARLFHKIPCKICETQPNMSIVIIRWLRFGFGA